MGISDENIGLIGALCAAHNVDKLYRFGSSTRVDFNINSDIDLLVRFKGMDLAKYFNNYISFHSKLVKLFRRKVDLVEEQTLKNPILIRSIDRNKELIYG